MPGNTSPDPGASMSDDLQPVPGAPYIDLQPVPGGGMTFTFTGAMGVPVVDWSMSHGQALILAARILGLLGYREVHLRDDHTVSSAS